MHWCANLVCGPEGQASAVLLRAGEVVAGESTARERRGEACPTRDLARGPARLASALGLSGLQNGLQTTDGDCPVPVSYTHLDVYKRQPLPLRAAISSSTGSSATCAMLQRDSKLPSSSRT